MNLTPQIIPHSCGKYSRQEFNKANMMIVERLINGLMQTENNTGKKGTGNRDCAGCIRPHQQEDQEKPD